jgi:hypothetical protein
MNRNALPAGFEEKAARRNENIAIVTETMDE